MVLASSTNVIPRKQFSGGNAYSLNSTNGEGGYSYIDPNLTIYKFAEAISGYHAGPGLVMIVPAVTGCGCKYLCIALDPRRSKVSCICPSNWKLDADGKGCISNFNICTIVIFI